VGRDSVVSIATRYQLDGLGIESRWGREFPHPSTQSPVNGYRVSFPGIKKAGRGVDHPPPPGAEVQERAEVYLYSPFWTFMACFSVNYSYSYSSSYYYCYTSGLDTPNVFQESNKALQGILPISEEFAFLRHCLSVYCVSSANSLAICYGSQYLPNLPPSTKGRNLASICCYNKVVLCLVLEIPTRLL
jgi:hypothetical protein